MNSLPGYRAKLQPLRPTLHRIAQTVIDIGRDIGRCISDMIQKITCECPGVPQAPGRDNSGR